MRSGTLTIDDIDEEIDADQSCPAVTLSAFCQYGISVSLCVCVLADSVHCRFWSFHYR